MKVKNIEEKGTGASLWFCCPSFSLFHFSALHFFTLILLPIHLFSGALLRTELTAPL